MSRAKLLVWISRGIFVAVLVTVCVLVFGPFGGAESAFGLSDKEAHASAFFVLTSLVLLSFPKMRRWDLAWLMVGFGGFIELVQGQIGRDCDLFDWIADCVGVLVVVAPVYIDRTRIAARGQVISTPRRRKGDRSRNLAGSAAARDVGVMFGDGRGDGQAADGSHAEVCHDLIPPPRPSR